MDDDDPWFAPKRYGFGAGLPIAWQGWALLGGFILAILLLCWLLLPEAPETFVAIALILGGAFAILAARKTRGGWRWRWGNDE